MKSSYVIYFFVSSLLNTTVCTILSRFQTCQISSSLHWEEDWRALVKSKHFAPKLKEAVDLVFPPQLVSLTLHVVMGSLWPEVISELLCFCLSHSIAPPLAYLSSEDIKQHSCSIFGKETLFHMDLIYKLSCWQTVCWTYVQWLGTTTAGWT